MKNTSDTIRVWSLPIRLFHWSLVALFVLAYLTGEDESLVHAYSGYAIGGLLAFRIIWGLVGDHYARFSNFLYAPSRVVAYLKSLRSASPQHYHGHNPPGGWMIIALLISLIGTTYTGLEVWGAEGYGPLATTPSSAAPPISRYDHDEQENNEHKISQDEEKHEHSDEEEFWEEAHEFFANFTVLLIIVHITGVLLSSLVHRENLVKAMINGYKARLGPSDTP